MQWQQQRDPINLSSGTKQFLGRIVSAMGRRREIDRSISLYSDSLDPFPLVDQHDPVKSEALFYKFVRYLVGLHSSMPFPVSRQFGLPYLENIGRPRLLKVVVSTGRPPMSYDAYRAAVLIAINSVYPVGMHSAQRDQLLNIYESCKLWSRSMNLARNRAIGSADRMLLNREIGKHPLGIMKKRR